MVEDGDPKGYQSNKGAQAKAMHGIQSWKLPPRTPQWMPLDYSIWEAITETVLNEHVHGAESKEQFLRRLRLAASSLSKAYVKSVLLDMKPRIQAMVVSKGKHIGRKD